MAKTIVIDARESGTGTGRYIDKLVEYLHKLKTDFDITVLTKAHRVEFMKSIAPSFKITESNFKEFSFSEQIDFLKQLKGLKADLVHFGMTQQPILYHGETITTIHDLTTARFTNPTKNWLIFKFKQLVYKFVIKRVAKKSAKIIVPSQFVKDDVAQYTKISPGKITVTYEAADKIHAAPEPIASLKNKEFIMYVGRAQPHKNLKRLVEAFMMLQKDQPGLRLVLVGKMGPNHQPLREFIAKKSAKNIVLTGYVTDGELLWLYENTKAYIFPSLSEGFGLPALEALKYGTPVVSSSTTCLPEIYGNAALYFDPKDVNDMAAKIAEVLKQPELEAKLRQAGPKQAAKYSWQRTAEQTLALYEQVLKGH